MIVKLNLFKSSYVNASTWYPWVDPGWGVPIHKSMVTKYICQPRPPFMWMKILDNDAKQPPSLAFHMNVFTTASKSFQFYILFLSQRDVVCSQSTTRDQCMIKPSCTLKWNDNFFICSTYKEDKSKRKDRGAYVCIHQYLFFIGRGVPLRIS